VIGTFAVGITVLSQQIRALNLAWSLVETGRVSTNVKPPAEIAIVGAGFAGLTFAAALLKKEVRCKISLFEEHDTLLPLQQGSDTRWLHPHIYDWPDKGSEADVANLPLLNWTAARASDVVVQILQGWSHIPAVSDVTCFATLGIFKSRYAVPIPGGLESSGWASPATRLTERSGRIMTPR
jgi:hypothetical protein